jgi:hypothetical protein
VDDRSSPQAKVAFYAALFVSRTDVYATRFDDPVPGKGGRPGLDHLCRWLGISTREVFD